MGARIWAAVLLWLALSVSAAAETVAVSSVSELRSAVSSANSSGGGVTILVADGTYTLDNGLYISAPGITIAGQSGSRDKVVIEGDEMSSTARVGNVITVAADDFTLEHVTLQKSRYHLIQIKGESDADSPTIRNCILRDAYEQILKVSVDLSNTSVSSDRGLVENCLFEDTAGIGPQFYIGGIDAHSSSEWVVRNNTFRNIISPSGSVAQYAVHFWNDSADNLVERNLVVDCDRGIGFGLNSRGNVGGTIKNNMIYHSGRGTFADVGIAIHNSPGTAVYNNTVYMEGSYPHAIEYRFGGTTGAEIVNNLTNRTIRRLDGANASLATNVENASLDWFVNAAAGDLHLAAPISAVVDQGTTLASVTRDFDGDRRDGAYDIGADEITSSQVRPNPPDNLRAD